MMDDELINQTELLLADIPFDLTRDLLSEQISGRDSSVDYMESIIDKCETASSYYDAETINNAINEFSEYVMMLLENEYNIAVDLEDFTEKEKLEIVYILYKILVIYHVPKLSNFIYSYIYDNAAGLSTLLNKNKKDVNTISYKKKFGKDGIILANVNELIDIVIDRFDTTNDIFSYMSDEGDPEYATIQEYLYNDDIIEVLGPAIFNLHDIERERVYGSVFDKLIKKYME